MDSRDAIVTLKTLTPKPNPSESEDESMETLPEAQTPEAKLRIARYQQIMAAARAGVRGGRGRRDGRGSGSRRIARAEQGRGRSHRPRSRWARADRKSSSAKVSRAATGCVGSGV